jgi:hypothetical protein
LIHAVGPVDSERRQWGELNTPSGCDVKHNTKRTLGL